MEVHTNLGMGFKEAVYPDALKIEFRFQGIPFIKENSSRSNIKELFCGTIIAQISLFSIL